MKLLALSLLPLVCLSRGPPSGAPCDRCSTRKELEDVRVEIIKEQILMKLRLKEPPSRAVRPVLPDPLVTQFLLSSGENHVPRESDLSSDGFYGTTQEVVIFPENASTHNCYTKDELRPSSCFRFRLTREVTTRSVTSAELWVHKVGTLGTNNSLDFENFNSTVTYTVVEVVPHPKHEGFSKRVVALERTLGRSEWLKFELAPAVRTWSLRKHMTHALEISCEGCDGEMESPVSLTDGQKPFIVVHTNSWKHSLKRKRDTVCGDSSVHCCKKYFKVDFRDIRWDTWVIYPMSYVANSCQGSCLSDLSVSRHHHTTVIRRYMRKHSLPESSLNLSLCCTASRMSPLTLIYMDERNNIFKKNLSNMIVESCSCS